MAQKTKRELVQQRYDSAVRVRAPYLQDWEEIARLALPSRSDYLGSSTTAAYGGASYGRTRRRANMTLRDGYGIRAARTLAYGMQSGLSPSSMPWFKLITTDPDLIEFQSVKEWLADVEKLIYLFLADIGFYDATKITYGELGCFGIGAGALIEHDEYIAVPHTMTAGEYAIALDDGNRAAHLYREVSLSVGQAMNMFGNAVSKQVKDAYDRGDHAMLVRCVHAIEKNSEYDPRILAGPRAQEYRSVWWEVGNPDKSQLLRESGYRSKPFWAPRWDVTGSGTYSDSAPGFNALPDLRELQLAARRRGRIRDYAERPPMKAPSGLSATILKLDPGSITYADAASLEGLGPIMQVDYRMVQAIREDQYELREDVGAHFYNDLFRAISEREGIQPLNDLETSLRNEEKYTQLGPVVDRVNTEMLEVAIDRAYDILDRSGSIPPAPKELQGQPLHIDFVSMLTQAQRASANTAIERAARFVGYVAGMFPEAAIKFDAEQAIDEFATGTGTPPRIIRSDEIVDKMKQDMAQQQQQAQMAQMAGPAKDAAGAAELLSRTQVGPEGQSLLETLSGTI